MGHDNKVLLGAMLHQKRIGAALYRLQQFCYNYLSEGCEKSNLTIGQSELLFLAAISPNLDQISLAKQIGIDRSSMTTLVDALEKKGFLRRNATIDRRKNQIEITISGQKALDIFLPFRAKLNDKMKSILNMENDGFIADLHKISLFNDIFITPFIKSDNPKLSELYNSPSFLIRRAFQITNAIYSEYTKSLNLNTMHYTVLILLLNSFADCQSDILKITNVNKSVVVPSIKQLELRGLVKIIPHPIDGRRNILSITNAGKEIISQIEPMIEAYENKFFENIKPDRRKKFMVTINQLVNEFYKI